MLLHSGFVLLLNYPEEKESALPGKVEELCQRLEKTLDIFEGLKLTVGVSCPAGQNGEIHRCIVTVGDAALEVFEETVGQRADEFELFTVFADREDSAVSPDELWLALSDLLISCKEIIGRELMMQQTRPIRVMKEYIEEHFAEGISLERVADPGEALMRKDYMTRAKYLGQNVGHAVLNPQIDWEHRWLGDLNDGEACPGCHLSTVIAKPGRDYVECVVCGRKGNISLDADGKMHFTWPEDNRDRLTMMGKFDHMREIARHTEERYEPHVEEIQEELKMYRQMEDFVVKAPSRMK